MYRILPTLFYIKELPINFLVCFFLNILRCQCVSFDNFKPNFLIFLFSVLMFVSHVLQSRLLLAATLLQDTHARSLQNFILTAFDLSRDLMITPKRIQYARIREEALYRSLLHLSYNKQDEIKNMITNTIFDIRDEVLRKASDFVFHGKGTFIELLHFSTLSLTIEDPSKRTY